MGFTIFSQILSELIRIRVALEGRKGLPLPEGDDIDESTVLYTDDFKAYIREKEEESYYAHYGRYPLPGETLPGPVDGEGREWSGEEGAAGKGVEGF